MLRHALLEHKACFSKACFGRLLNRHALVSSRAPPWILQTLCARVGYCMSSSPFLVIVLTSELVSAMLTGGRTSVFWGFGRWLNCAAVSAMCSCFPYYIGRVSHCIRVNALNTLERRFIFPLWTLIKPSVSLYVSRNNPLKQAKYGHWLRQ